MQNDDNKGNEENTRRNMRKTTNRLSSVNLLPCIPSKKLRLLGYSNTRMRPISKTFGTKTDSNECTDMKFIVCTEEGMRGIRQHKREEGIG
jgi:hypothetical protein